MMKSPLGDFKTFREVGVQPQVAKISEFNFSKPDYRDVTMILAYQICLPSRYWALIEHFVKHGGKLIMDGLTAYYDEHAHCIMKTGFPLANLCGASVKEFKLKGNLFDVELSDPELVLTGHCWQGALQLQTATPIGYATDEIIASRHSFGDGEVLWMPTLLGMGARLKDTAALAKLLNQEAAHSIRQIPFRFTRHQPGVLSRTLISPTAYVTILINKNSQPFDIELTLPDSLPLNCQPKIFASIQDGQIGRQNKFHLPPEETLVLKWNLE